MAATMPEQFTMLDNLQYTDANGNVRTLDVSVKRGSLSGNAESGTTSYRVDESTGIIRSGTPDATFHTVSVTLDRNGFPNTALPHEGGHIVTLAKDPRAYKKMVEAAGVNYDCQDPRNANNPMSKTALEWQRIRSRIR